MEQVILSFNTIMPLFMVGALGYVLMRVKVIDQHFVDVGSGLCFKVLLPILLFKELYTSKELDNFNTRLVLFSLGGMVAILIGCIVLTPMVMKGSSKARIGAVAHGIYRSNFVFIGLPIMESMFGAEGTANALAVLPFAVALFNVGAVIIFTIFAPEDSGVEGVSLKKILKSIAKNPLIIALAIAAAFVITGIKLPVFLEKSIVNIGATATPMALLTLGAQLDFKAAAKNLKVSGAVTFLRLVVLPGVMVALGALVGFRGAELGLLLILYGAPSAVSGFAMAKSMKSDAALTSEITILTTFFSTLSLFLGIVAIGFIQ